VFAFVVEGVVADGGVLAEALDGDAGNVAESSAFAVG
jgi:hypothetical protein